MMKKLLMAIGFAAVAWAPTSSQAQAPAWPSKPIRLIVPFPPGGGNDVIGRIIGQQLQLKLGQPVVIDNKPGANGILGLQSLLQSPADGYTIAVGAAGPLAVNPTLYDKLPYDAIKSFAPITNVAHFPLLLVANTNVPVKDVHGLVAYAKSKPGEVFYASPGAGNSGHIAGELFNLMAGTTLTAVQYKGNGPAMTDLMGGHVQLMWSSIPSVLPYVQQKRLQAIGVASLQRITSMPDMPTIAESGLPGYEAYSWVGMVAPAGTPKDIVTRLNREIVEIVRDPAFAEALSKQGAFPVGDTPEHFEAYIKSEIEKWGKVVKAGGIKPE